MRGRVAKVRGTVSASVIPTDTVNDRLSSRADAPGQVTLRQPEPTTKSFEWLVVVVRDRRQGRRTWLLPAKPTVMSGHEPLGGRARHHSPRSAEHGLHGEVRVESAGPDGRLQRANVDVEFLGQLVERQPFVLSLVMDNRLAGTLEHRDGDCASTAIQWPVGLKRNRQRGDWAEASAMRG